MFLVAYVETESVRILNNFYRFCITIDRIGTRYRFGRFKL